MRICKIEARDLSDVWFQAVYNIIEEGRKSIIDRGSYAGQTRLEYDYFMGHIKFPGNQPLIPEIPIGCGIPNPVEHDYIYGGEGYNRSYIEYLMTGEKAEGESYTYGSRMCEAPLLGEKLKWFKEINKDIINEFNIDGKCLFERNGVVYLNQIEWIIDVYKKYGYNNNQMILQIGEPTDSLLIDPPCLRQIGCKIIEEKLNFFVNFRCLTGKNSIVIKSNGNILRTNIETLYDLYEEGNKIEVISVDNGLEPIWGNVVDVNKCIKNNVVLVELFGGGELELTEDHRVPVFEGNIIIEKEIRDLKRDDVLIEHKFLSKIRNYTNNYIDLLEVLKDNKKVYVSDVLLDTFKILNIDNETWKNKKHIPINKYDIAICGDDCDLNLKCQKQQNIPRMFKITEEMSYFMGLWLADGWYNNRNNGLRVVIEDSNTLKLQRIIRFLKDEFNYVPSIEHRKGCKVLNIAILFLAELFKALGFIHGSKIKIIPNFMFNMPKNLLEEFFTGWYSGDAGCSTSKELISDFSIILKFLDERFSIYSEKDRKVFFKKENREIMGSASQRILPLNYKTKRLEISDKLIGRKVKKVTKLSSEKMVYDIAVDTNSHLFFCGQLPILVHNSWDLWSGSPANLAGIQILKEYMAGEIGVEDGEMIIESKGLHLYGYAENLAKLRCAVDPEQD